MARIRTIKPEYWGHHKTAKLSLEARLLFLGLLNFADDQGLMLGSSVALIGQVFPNDEIPTRRFERWMVELIEQEMVRRYTVAGVRYLSICGFTEHQKISHPAKSYLPKPSGDPPEVHPNGTGSPPVILSPDLGSRNLDLGSGHNGASAVPDPRVGTLVAGYIEDYGSERKGKRPDQRWVAAAGRAIKTALASGEDPEDLAKCLGVIAHESKQPATLPHVLADYHQGRERRIK